MSRRFFKNQSGIVLLAPIVAIGAILLIAFTFKNSMDFPQGDDQTKVLSESEEDGSGGEVEGTEDGQLREEEELEQRTQSGDEDGESVSTNAETRSRLRIESDEDDDEDEDENEEEDEELEDEDESEDDEESETEVEIETEESESVKVKIRSKNGRFEIETEGIQAGSNFPISVNSETNELIITTPSGEKIVTILPDQAVENMIRNGFIDASLSVEIQDGESELEYEIEGLDSQKLLGVFDVKIAKKFKVSANDGDIINVDQSLFSKLLDLISI